MTGRDGRFEAKSGRSAVRSRLSALGQDRRGQERTGEDRRGQDCPGQEPRVESREPAYPRPSILETSPGSSVIDAITWVGRAASRVGRSKGPQRAATVTTPAALPALTSCGESPTKMASSGA